MPFNVDDIVLCNCFSNAKDVMLIIINFEIDIPWNYSQQWYVPAVEIIRTSEVQIFVSIFHCLSECSEIMIRQMVILVGLNRALDVIPFLGNCFSNAKAVMSCCHVKTKNQPQFESSKVYSHQWNWHLSKLMHISGEDTFEKIDRIWFILDTHSKKLLS